MSKTGLNEKVDVIVIGAGVAGAVSAAFLAKSGLKVAIIDKLGGASLQSSGAVDVASQPAVAGQTSSFENAASQLAKSQRLHPYSKVGENQLVLMLESLHILRELAQDVDFCLRDDGRNMLLATQLGTVKQSAMVQRTQSFDCSTLDDGDCIGVVGFSALPSFDARAVSRMLAWSISRQQKKNVVVEPLQVELGLGGRTWRSAMEMARAVDDPRISSDLIGEIKKRVAQEERKHAAVLLPPILGRAHYRRHWHTLNENGDNRCFELLAMPHSVPGLRLKNALIHGLKRLNVEVIEGEVVQATMHDAIVENIVVEYSGQRSVHSSRAVVLGTGRFLSGGFKREGTRREKIFDLPLWDEAKPIENAHVLTLSNENLLKEQSIFNVGLSVDEKLRPHNQHMELFALNLFATGSSIGGYDSSGISSGLGVAAITGLVSGTHTRDYLMS